MGAELHEIVGVTLFFVGLTAVALFLIWMCKI